MSRKSASNVVLLIKGTEIVARFEPGADKEGVEAVTPAMTKANAFLELVLQDQEHPLHGALIAGEIERVNSKPEKLVPRARLSI